MKLELEILDSDLEDRKVIIEMRSALEERIEKLSEFSRNNLVNEINRLRGQIEWLENGWLKWQRERVLNKFSEAMNIDRQKLGDRDWHDDNE